MAKKKDKAPEQTSAREWPYPDIFLGSWPTERQAGKHAASYRETHPGETADIKPEADAFAVYVSSYSK